MSTTTEPRPQYWDGGGKFKAEANRLHALVPISGRAQTIAVELVRCLSNVTYERFNNSNSNRDIRMDEARFVRAFKHELTAFVGGNQKTFDFTPEELTAAVSPVLTMKGGSHDHYRETDIVCDAVYKWAATLSGEPVFPEEGEAGFLAAITTDPTDVMVRLAYADWLDDRNLPQRARDVRTHAFLLNFQQHLLCGVDGPYAGEGPLTLRLNKTEANALAVAAVRSAKLEYKEGRNEQGRRLEDLRDKLDRLAKHEK